MNFFVVMNGRKLKKYFMYSVAILFVLGIVYSEKTNITVFSQSEPAAVYSVPTDKKMIALTFDISWGDKRPGPIIDILKEKGITKTTFFLSSPWSKSHPDLVDQLVSAGFEIGSHGHKHTNYSKLDDDQIREQIQTADEMITNATGKKPDLIRLPNGDFDKRVLRIAGELDYTVIQWDTDSLDWQNPGVDEIVQRVVNNAHPGDIVLMHASDSCQQTHLALPAIIDQLKAQGYEFVTVSELMNQVETKDNRVESGSAT